MPFSLQQGHGRTAYCLLCLTANLFFYSIAAAQHTRNTGRDTSNIGMRQPYYSFTLLTGAAAQFYTQMNGLFTVSFPYKVVDSSGAMTSAVFLGQKRDIYGAARYYAAPFVIAIAWLHDVVHLGFGLSFGSGSNRGLEGFFGYGRICYVGRRVMLRNGMARRYALKFSLDLWRYTDYQVGNYNSLGSIDNRNKTIYLLGQEAGTTFTVPGSRYTPAQTYAANTLDICYDQSEWSIMPRISILPNPYRRKSHFELTIGYNLPISDYGKLSFIQSAGNKSEPTGGTSILNTSVSASYNNQPLRSALDRFQGIYIGLAFDLIARKEN